MYGGRRAAAGWKAGCRGRRGHVIYSCEERADRGCQRGHLCWLALLIYRLGNVSKMNYNQLYAPSARYGVETHPIHWSAFMSFPQSSSFSFIHTSSKPQKSLDSVTRPCRPLDLRSSFDVCFRFLCTPSAVEVSSPRSSTAGSDSSLAINRSTCSRAKRRLHQVSK